MNGPEHYAEAERRLSLAADWRDRSAEICEHYAALAQVHATLALAAATALDPYADSTGTSRVSAWLDVAS